MLKCLFAIILASTTLLAEESSYTKIEDKTIYPILSPTLKDRQVAKIRLQNGVEALLISDPEATQSAAAVCMEAGSWQDPEEYPGMAHFLEHMLFMGTKAYPEEDDFSKYVQDEGGKINAFTASDRTVYMFSVNNSGFIGALDRFSHFFIDPLFNSSSVNRELQAVDQEHSKNVENDHWRAYMVLKETSSVGHPMTKFSTGNADTLGGIPPKALKEWYETHYSADKLHLVVLSALSIEELTELVITDFSAVTKVRSISDPSLEGPILSKKQQGSMIYIQPIKDLKLLSMKWEMPKNLSTVEQKWTEALISYALSEASDTSLLHQLKKEKLVEGISAGSDRFGKEELFFHINIALTDKGVSQLDTIILRTYQALARLKQSGLPLSLFQEMQTIAKMNYQYQSRQEPFRFVMEMGYSLADEPLATFPEKTEVPAEFNPEELLQFLTTLTPETAVYVLLADTEGTGVEMNEKEKWMEVPYTIKQIPSSKIGTWQQATPHAEIALPPSNPFIPKELSLVSDEVSLKKIIPVKIVDTPSVTCYFANDLRYKTPEGSLLLRVFSSGLDGSAKAEVLAALISKRLDDTLASTLFFAGEAGLSGSISSAPFSMVVSVDGFSEKAPNLALELLDSLYKVHCTEEEFSLYKESLLSAYKNGAFELPVSQGMQSLMSVLKSDYSTSLEKEKVLESLSYEEFVVFAKNYLSSAYLEGMIYGNFSKEEIENLGKSIEKTLEPSAPYTQRMAPQVLLLSGTEGPFKLEKATLMQGNGAVLAIELGSASVENTALQKILSDPLHEAFFDTLRTKQQTGYIAQSWPRELEKELVQFFAVQSSSVLPDNLLVRFELFLEDFSKRMQEIIPQERFEGLKQSQIALLKAPLRSMDELNTHLYYLAFRKDADFYWREKVIESIANLSYEEFTERAYALLSKENRRRLASLVRGKEQERPFFYHTIAKDEASSIGTLSSVQ